MTVQPHVLGWYPLGQMSLAAAIGAEQATNTVSLTASGLSALPGDLSAADVSQKQVMTGVAVSAPAPVCLIPSLSAKHLLAASPLDGAGALLASADLSSGIGFSPVSLEADKPAAGFATILQNSKMEPEGIDILPSSLQLAGLVQAQQLPGAGLTCPPPQTAPVMMQAVDGGTLNRPVDVIVYPDLTNRTSSPASANTILPTKP